MPADRRFPCAEATVDLRFPGFMLRFWLDREGSLDQIADRIEAQRVFAAGVVQVLQDKGFATMSALNTEDVREVLGLFAEFGEVNAVQLVHRIDSIDLGGAVVVVSHGGMLYSVEF